MLLRLAYSLQNVPWVVTVNSSAGIISIVWLIHYLGMFLMVGTTVFVDLRILGLAGHKLDTNRLAGALFPWMWVGLVMVMLSGFIMFAGQATTFYPATVFQIKLLVILLALIFGAVVQRRVAKWDRLAAASGGAKLLALVSLVLWIGAILASLEVAAFLPV